MVSGQINVRPALHLRKEPPVLFGKETGRA